MKGARKIRTRRHRTSRKARGSSESRLEELIAEATVDCYDRSEQVAGFFSMLEEQVEVPFETRVLGLDVSVEEIILTDAGVIAAICRQGRFRQRISILDLPLPAPTPKGAEWIEAYRRWSGGS
jgi:hypothetical protein